MKKTILILGVSFLFSCEKEIILDADETAPRIVINSLFNSNDTCWIHVSESRNVLYNDVLPNITTANARLLDVNGNSLGSFTHLTDGLYYIASPFPQAGNVYGIEVSATGFTDVKASSETPSLILISTIDTATTNSQTKLSFNLSFLDDVSQDNYYGISIIVHGLYDDGSGTYQEWSEAYFETQEIFTDNGESDPSTGLKYAQEFYFSDETFNGQTKSFNGLQYYSALDSLYYVVTLRSMSEDLYKYRISYAKYVEAQGNIFAEPVQVYSNIENGFGIFGGSSEFVDTIFIE